MSVSKLCEELVKANQDIEVLCTTANGLKELNTSPGKKQLVEGVSVTYFKRLTKDHSHFSPALLVGLNKILTKNKSEGKQSLKACKPIMHIHAWWNLVSMLSCLIGVCRGCLIILSPRGTLSNYSFSNNNGLLKFFFHNTIGKFLLERCHFHVTSLKEKKEMLALCNPKSIHVIPNFVRLPKEQFSLIKESKLFKLIFMSRIERKKGLEILFRALEKTKIPYILTIAGTGDDKYLEELKYLSRELKIEDKVEWIGHQDDANKFRILSEHHLFVLPSHDENFANIVIESLSVGTAVLISEHVGLSDYVKKHKLGWIVKNDPLSFKQKIENLFVQRTLLEIIREAAPPKIKEDFDDNKLILDYLTMYNELSSY